MAARPETRYARSGDIGIAYQVVGEGPTDIVLAFPFMSHLDLFWENQAFVHSIRRLATFARVILFDRRGVGLSDNVEGAPTLEERMDDLRAVMDAAGSERAVLFGMSEGGTVSMLFSATYPERVAGLVLWGAMARSTAAEDYPWAPEKEALVAATDQLIGPMWGQGATIDIFSPSVAEDPRAREFNARLERSAASPRRVQQLVEMFLDTDVREAVPSIRVPTLIMHRNRDRAVNVRSSRWLAEHIEGSRYIELDGDDHVVWVGDSDTPLREIEQFVTGVRPAPAPDRVLATVVFTDIVDSTRHATELGDHRWRELLAEHQELVREHLDRYGGREVKTTGDGFLALFDGPTRATGFAQAVVTDVAALGIEVRAGVHTGEVELIDDDVGGIGVHVAARICGRAEGGSVLTSGTVRDLAVGSGIDFDPAGSHDLKGLPEQWSLYRVALPPAAIP